MGDVLQMKTIKELRDQLTEARERLGIRRNRRMQRDYEALLQARAWEQETVEMFESVLRESLGKTFCPVIEVPPKPEKRPKFSEAAVLCIGDSHAGKIVLPDQTLGFGDYNLDVFADRAWHLQETAIKLMTAHLYAPPKELWVFFLGDLVEGGLDHHQEIPQRELIAEQVLFAGWTFYQLLANLSRVVPLKVRGVVGNHGRWPGQKKMPTENRYSNLDWIVMGHVRHLCKATLGSRVDMQIARAPFIVEDIEGWRVKVGHGDHLKGGDRAMGVPAHAIGREVNATTQRYAARGEKVPSFYIVGDKHRKLELPTADGRYLINGAFFDCDSYALSANFTPTRPYQIFFGMDRDIGRTWTYDIALDLRTKPHKYTYP